MMADAIEVADLTVERGGVAVLHGLSFSVAEHSVTGLVGPSGSGKTTLMRCLVGVQQHASGLVRTLGRRPGSLEARRRIGYVTQAPSTYRDLTVRENLRYFAAVIRAPRERVAQVMADVSMANLAERRVDRLSGGQQSRVSLATALLGRPELLVLDEPTVGLDPVLREELWALFHRIADSGTTLIVSSHVMDEADRCQRILLLRDGRLLAEGTPTELRERTGAGTLDEAFLHLVARDRGR